MGGDREGESPYFVQYNRDKRSIALDIRREEGRAILLELVKRSDVLIENFRPGTMRKLGLSYSFLRRLKPENCLLLRLGVRADRAVQSTRRLRRNNSG